MRKLLTLLSFVVLGIVAFAQSKTISGTVIGDDGLPIMGATVVVKGTTIGTVTDYDGNYTLSVPANAEALQFRFVGMQDLELPINGQSKINATLQSDSQAVEEIMVVAYGTAKKSSFTGSAGQVNADRLAERSVSNATKALAGQVPGVQVTSNNGQPGSSAKIRIRGIGSMYASNNPLYIVDGVPYEADIASINPSDIESMTVLKDAAASAIYGARGANGVVLINTKKGKAGEGKISFEAKWGNNQRGVPNYDVITDPRMYYEVQYRALYNNALLNRGMSEADAHVYANNNLVKSFGGYQIFTVPEGENLVGTNFKMNPKATLGYYSEASGNYYINDDWYKEMFATDNMRQEYNLSASGNVDKINYYLSLGYLEDSGIINRTGYTRYSARVHADYQAKEYLKMGTNMSYTNSNVKADDDTFVDNWGGGGNAFWVANNIAPIYPMYYRNADGTIRKDAAGNILYDFGANVDAKRPNPSQSNPKADYELNDRNKEIDNFNGKWFITVTPITGLNITATVGATANNSRSNEFWNPLYGSAVSVNGAVQVEHERMLSINQQYLATYNKTINETHNLDLLVGYESFQTKRQELGVYNENMYNPTVAEISNTVGDKPKVASNTYHYATVGILGRVQYDYAGKYFLSGSFRRDASSRFHPDSRWGTFGSVGAAWLMSEEDFIKNIDFINMLKIKGSYGVQGNDDLLDTSGYSIYKPYEDYYKVSYSGDPSNPFSVKFERKGNKDITWETSHAFNVGADFELFKGRISGSVEYFYRETSDMLFNQPVPKVLGYSTFPTNVGTMENKGFEFNLEGVIFKTKDFDWSINVNGTHVANEITDLAPSVKKDGIKSGSRIYKIGSSVYQSYLHKSAGIDKTDGQEQYYVDPDNGDWTVTKEYNSSKQADCGTTLPALYGGFGTQVHAYGVDFALQFSYQLGGKIYDGTYEELMHTGQPDCANNWHKDILKAWTPENTNTNTPRISTGDNRRQLSSDRYLVKSDYLSFNSIVLGYTLPKDLTKKFYVEKFRIYGTCDNVALFSYRKGLDPRQSLAPGGSTTSGNFNYSALRTISGGIQLEF